MLHLQQREQAAVGLGRVGAVPVGVVVGEPLPVGAHEAREVGATGRAGAEAGPGVREGQPVGFLGRGGQVGVVVGQDDAVVAAAAAAAGDEQVAVGAGAVQVDVLGDQLARARALRHQDVHARQPVHRQPVQARQQAVAAADDVPARADRIARAAGQGAVGGLVQVQVAVPVLVAGRGREAVARGGIPGRGDVAGLAVAQAGHQAQVDDGQGLAVVLRQFVGHEAFVAVAAAAHRDAAALGQRGVGRVEHVLRGLADIDGVGALARGGEAQVETLLQGRITRVIAVNQGEIRHAHLYG